MTTATPTCPNCAAVATKPHWGGYSMACVGCCARLVLSARPVRKYQEGMLSCVAMQGNGRPERPTRQQVLDRIKAMAKCDV